MDYDEFWKKWLFSVVEEIIRNNIMKSRQMDSSVDNVGQTFTSFAGNS